MASFSSFSEKLRAGWSKEQLMKHYAMPEQQYDRVIACLKQIKAKQEVA
jgi:hypothetical protein